MNFCFIFFAIDDNRLHSSSPTSTCSDEIFFHATTFSHRLSRVKKRCFDAIWNADCSVRNTKINISWKLCGHQSGGEIKTQRDASLSCNGVLNCYRRRNGFWQLGEQPFKRRPGKMHLISLFNIFSSFVSRIFSHFSSFVSYRLDFCFHSQVFITKFTLLLPLYHIFVQFHSARRLFALVKSVSTKMELKFMDRSALSPRS